MKLKNDAINLRFDVLIYDWNGVYDALNEVSSMNMFLFRIKNKFIAEIRNKFVPSIVTFGRV